MGTIDYTRNALQMRPDGSVTGALMPPGGGGPNLPKGRVSSGWMGKFVAGNFVVDTAINKAMGNSWTDSVMKGAFNTAMVAVAPEIAIAQMGAAVFGAAAAVHKGLNTRIKDKTQSAYKSGIPGFGPGFADTQQAYTMRQAAVQAIQGSKMNARNALGGEASLLHRQSRVISR